MIDSQKLPNAKFLHEGVSYKTEQSQDVNYTCLNTDHGLELTLAVLWMGYLTFIKDATWLWGGGDEPLRHADTAAGVRHAPHTHVVVPTLGQIPLFQHLESLTDLLHDGTKLQGYTHVRFGLYSWCVICIENYADNMSCKIEST